MILFVPGIVGLLVSVLLLSPARSGSLKACWIDVGGGAVTLVVTPTGETILIGMGLPGDRDPSGINKLIREGVGTTKIDHLVITHFERDHYGGATAALGAMRE